MWHTASLISLRHMGPIFQTRDWTQVSILGAWKSQLLDHEGFLTLIGINIPRLQVYIRQGRTFESSPRWTKNRWESKANETAFFRKLPTCRLKDELLSLVGSLSFSSLINCLEMNNQRSSLSKCHLIKLTLGFIWQDSFIKVSNLRGFKTIFLSQYKRANLPVSTLNCENIVWVPQFLLKLFLSHSDRHSCAVIIALLFVTQKVLYMLYFKIYRQSVLPRMGNLERGICQKPWPGILILIWSIFSHTGGPA